MSEKRKYTPIPCPICAWSCNRSFFLPKHIIKHHITDITLAAASIDHCIAAYVKNKKKELDFCVCLTCDSGFVGDVMSAQGSRWLNTHSKKTECTKAHKDALIAFKNRKVVAPSEPAAQITSIPRDSIEDLWSQIKATSNYKDLCIQKEENAKQYHDNDSDAEGEFVFDPAEGIMDILHDAAIYKKQVDKYKNALSNHEAQQEKKDIETQNKVMGLETMIATMKYNINRTTNEYIQRIETLEEELRTKGSI